MCSTQAAGYNQRSGQVKTVKIVGLIGLLMFALFLAAMVAIARLRRPDPGEGLTRGKILLIGAIALVVFLIYRWLESLPWLPRHP